jgi:hypothetical protein
MICEKCNQEMKQLFNSWYCDCDEQSNESDVTCKTSYELCMTCGNNEGWDITRKNYCSRDMSPSNIISVTGKARVYFHIGSTYYSCPLYYLCKV